MFKQVLSSLSESIVGGAKDYTKQFTKEKATKKTGEFLENSIRNLGGRSPILQGVSTAIADNIASINKLNELRDRQMHDFLKSEKSAPMRESVKASLGPNTKDSTVTKEMIKILGDVRRLVDREGVVKAKETELYKKNEKFVAEYYKTVLETAKKSNEESKKSSETNKESTTTSKTTEPANPKDRVGQIIANTSKTVEILETISQEGSISGEKKNSLPTTISGAFQQIGGTFLSKVFDEKTIERFSDHIKSKVTGVKKEETSTLDTTKTNTVANLESVSNQSSVLNTINGSANQVTHRASPTNKEVYVMVGGKPVNKKLQQSNISEAEREFESAEGKSKKEQEDTLESILEELEKQTKLAEEAKKEKADVESKKDDKKTAIESALEGTKDKLLESAGRRLPGLGRAAGTLAGKIGSAAKKGIGGAINAAGRAASYIPTIAQGAGQLAGRAAAAVPGALSTVGELASGALTGLGTLGGTALGGLTAGGAALGAAGVAAAGAGGYALGKYAINPLINKGISAATGGETSLGSWIYDKMNPQADFNKPPTEAELAAAKTTRLAREAAQVSAAKTTDLSKIAVETQRKAPATEVQRLSEVKETQAAKQAAAAAQPIVINNTTPAAQSKTSQQQPTSVGMSIRNPDSTYERVQMQDFWARSK